MSDGYEIPISADLTGLAEAIAKISEYIVQMGQQISTAMGSSNSALTNTENGMRRVQGTATTVTAANQQLSASFASSRDKMQGAVTTAANLGTAMTGLQSGLSVTSQAARVLRGVNLAASLSGWVTSAGGIRAAFAKIPATLSAIAANPVFRRIAIGAVAAVAAIIAIRTATRVIGAALRAMGGIAAGIFRGMVATARTAARAVGSAFKGIASMPGKIFTSIPGIGGLLAGAGAIALLVTQLKGASDKAAVFEDLTVSVEHFTGSIHAAKTLLGDLATFAIKTPFETIDVQQTAAGLLGAGVRDDVAGITKDLAAMAKNGQQLGELGDAMGKGFAKGKFQTEEVNKFLERGINLIPALQSELGLTGKEFQKAVEAGLGFGTVTAAIRAMSSEGGQFFGLLDRRAQTFTGLLSTLSAAWTDVRQAFGAPINDALKPILQSGIDAVTSLLEKARTIGATVGNAITLAFVAFKQGKVGDLFSAGLKLGVAVAIDALLRGLKSAVAFLAAAFPPVIALAMSKFSDPVFWSGLGLIFRALGQTLAAEIRSALPMPNDAKIQELREGSESNMKSGSFFMKGAGAGENIGETLVKSLEMGIAAASKQMGEDVSPRVKIALASLKNLTEGMQSAADAIKKKTAEGTALKGTAIAPASGAASLEPSPKDPPLESVISNAVSNKMETLTTSLGRVGGGGGKALSFGGVIGKMNQLNTGIQQIVRNTASKSAPASHVLS